MRELDENRRKKIRSDVHTRNSLIKSQRSKARFFAKYCLNKDVLDLGSLDHHPENALNESWLFFHLQEASSSIKGLDYYAAGVEEIQKAGFPIVFGDAQSFHFDEQFDVVTAGDLIEHLADLNGFITSIKKVLRPGGSLILSTPNPWCWKYLGYHLAKGRLYPLNPEHVSWFCIQTLVQLLERYKFSYENHMFSSERFYENIIPLPAHVKHTTLNIRFIAR